MATERKTIISTLALLVSLFALGMNLVKSGFVWWQAIIIIFFLTLCIWVLIEKWTGNLK